MAGRLQGRAAIVTGAGRGFGKAIAMGLAREGAAVTLVSRTKAQLEGVKAEIEAAGGKAHVAIADVVDKDQVFAAVKSAEAALGPISILVNNAGRAEPYGPIGFIDPETWWTTQALHVYAPFLFMSAVIPGMRERRFGHIINICSLGGREITPSVSGYSVSKNTEIRLTEHVAAENREFNVFAFPIEPGTVITDLAESTMTHPDAIKYVPWMIEALKGLKAHGGDPKVGLERCAQICINLASGKYDGLTGRYLEPKDDFDALLKHALENPIQGVTEKKL